MFTIFWTCIIDGINSPKDIANDVGVQIKEIHIRRMTKKWASCSSKGRLTFDPSLLEESKEKRTEAVLHELLHLRYPNHGKMFHLALNEYFAGI